MQLNCSRGYVLGSLSNCWILLYEIWPFCEWIKLNYTEYCKKQLKRAVDCGKQAVYRTLPANLVLTNPAVLDFA